MYTNNTKEAEMLLFVKRELMEEGWTERSYLDKEEVWHGSVRYAADMENIRSVKFTIIGSESQS